MSYKDLEIWRLANEIVIEYRMSKYFFVKQNQIPTFALHLLQNSRERWVSG